MYADREVFVNPPLELVAAEIRFAYTPGLARREVHEKIAQALAGVTPVTEFEQFDQIELVESAPPKVEKKARFRLLNRQSTLSVSIETDRLAIETTDYPEFEEFKQALNAALDALVASVDIGGFSRVGIRFIDEIRLPSHVSSVADWTGWINEDLLGPTRLLKESPSAFQSVIQYQWEEDYYLNLRFGALEKGSALSTPLKRNRQRGSGPYFLLDIDSYWQLTGQMDPFDADRILSILDRLHVPAGRVFVASLTEQIKTEVLRKVAV